jgi:hypothetical protein
MENEYNEFGLTASGGPVTKTKSNGGGMVAVAQQREIAEVQAAMLIARMNPRDEKAALDRILQACTRPKLAEAALYQYNKGGTDVSGPSIRLAEVLAQSWGNFECGVRELEQTDEESTVEAYAWDIQTNFRDKKTFHVPHIRHTRKGSYKLSDPRDIYEMVANQGARRKRACILAVIPGDVQEAAVKQCELTLVTKADVTPERLKSLVEKFSELGVTKEMIEARIQRRLEAMTPALLVQMGKIYNSLKDGMSTVADWFAVSEKQGPEKGALSLDDLKAGKEENRGHGNENLDQVGKTQQEAGTKAPAPASESKSRQASRSRANPPAAAPQSAGNPNYVEGSDPDPFAQNGELFGSREPGQEG